MNISEELQASITRAINRRRLLRDTTMAAFGATAAFGTAGHFTPAAAASLSTIVGVLLDRGGAVFNVKAYGAKGNGSTDDTQAIQKTISAVQNNGGGIVYFPEGTYLISASLSITQGGITLAGAGQTATTLLIADTYPNGDVITFTNLNTGSVRMLTINSPVPRTGGAAIHLNNASRVYIQDVDMNNMYIGCQIDGAGGVLQYIDRGYWTNFSPGGIGIWIAISNSNGNDQYISNICIDNTSVIANQPLAGLRIQGSQAVWARALDIIHCQQGLLIDPPAGGLITWCFFADCAWDTCGYHCMLINPASGAMVKGLNFMDCWSASAQTYDGCYIGGPVDGVQFVGHRFFNNTGNGLIVVGPATNVFVDGSGAAGNNGGNSGSSGFAFTNNCQSFAVRNCRTGAYANFPVTQQNGIIVTPGCNNYILTGNITLGNIIGINDAGGPNKVVANNL
jgi:hypothetical protein